MDQKIIDYIASQTIGVISVVLEDGTPHGAEVHYSHDTNPFRIYIQTSGSSMKAQPFLNGKVGKASFVIGSSQEEWITVQMHGDMRSLNDKESLDQAYAVHCKKVADAESRRGPETVILEFTPIWVRYTDFKTKPATILGI